MVWKVLGFELSKDAPWNFKGHNLISRKFAGFGAYASRHVWITFVLGALVTFIFCFGVYLPTTNKDFDDLWMRRNDRLRPEAEKYDQYFGGLPRQHSITIRRSNGATFGTEISLNTMRAVIDPILHPNDNTLSSRLTFNSFLGASGSTPIAYGGTEFCETAGVPPAFRRLGYNVAYGYRQLTTCLLSPSQWLPDGWEITSFPCRRYSALDCFAEGNFDYPSPLKQLDAVSRLVAASPSLESCLTQLQANLTSLMNSSSNAAAVVAQTRTAVQLFKRWGYSNRYSYTGKTRTELMNYLYGLKDSDSLDGATCQDKGRPCCLSWDGTKVPRQLVFDQEFVDARTTWFDYNTDSPIYANLRPLSGPAARLELSQAWEGAVRDFLLPKAERQTGSGFESAGIYGAHSLNFIVQRSVNDQVTTATGPEVYIICVGYVLVLCYSGLVLSKWSIPYTAANAVYSRLMLAVSGVFVVMFATIAAFGFAGVVGIEYNYLVVNTVPMLSLLFGMHNVYILVSTMLGFSNEQDVTTRIKRTWAVAGPSIFLKTIVCATVFMVASTYPVPLVRSLCWFLAVCEVANFWTLLTIYSPLVVMDARRTNEKRTDCCVPPCVILGGEDFTAIGSESQYDETGRFVGRFIRKYEGLLTHLVVKLAILAAFITFLVVFCVLGFQNNYETTRQAETAALAYPNSYVRNYFNAIDGKFAGSENLLVTVGTDIANVQANLLQTMSSLGSSPFNAHLNASLERSWLAAPTAGVLTAGAVSTSAFETLVQSWIRTTNLGYLYRNQFACRWSTNKAAVSCLSFDANLHEIAASQIPVFNSHAQWTNEYVDTIENNRAIVDSINAQSFVYGPTYRFYHNFIGAKNDLYATVGWCMLATLLICLLFQFQITATAITLFVIMTGVLEMWGLTHFISVHVNPFMTVNMCYQIALLVAFTVHLVHVFQIKKGDSPGFISSRNQRVTGALEEVLSGSWHMYVSGFFAVVVMSRSTIPFLNYYYWGMFAMMQFVALVNGMILLPVLLSLCGPTSLYDEYAAPADTSLGNESIRNLNAADNEIL